jgi:hypothetical protein
MPRPLDHLRTHRWPREVSGCRIPFQLHRLPRRVPRGTRTPILSGLEPDRDYEVEVVCRDPAGNTRTDDNAGKRYRFRTLKPIQPPFLDGGENGARQLDRRVQPSTRKPCPSSSPRPGNSAVPPTNSPPPRSRAPLAGAPTSAAKPTISPRLPSSAPPSSSPAATAPP